MDDDERVVEVAHVEEDLRWFTASPRTRLGPHPGRLTAEAADRIRTAGEVVEVVVHPALLLHLVDWLDGLGVDLVEGPRQ